MKEFNCYKRHNVIKVVPRSSVPAGAPKPLVLDTLLEYKKSGAAKARTVARGQNETKGFHYIHSASPMVAFEHVLFISTVCASLSMTCCIID